MERKGTEGNGRERKGTEGKGDEKNIEMRIERNWLDGQIEICDS